MTRKRQKKDKTFEIVRRKKKTAKGIIESIRREKRKESLKRREKRQITQTMKTNTKKRTLDTWNEAKNWSVKSHMISMVGFLPMKYVKPRSIA